MEIHNTSTVKWLSYLFSLDIISLLIYNGKLVKNIVLLYLQS